MQKIAEKFAIVVSRFNEEVTTALLDGALRGFSKRNIAQDALTIVHVPGAVEVPFAAQLLAKTKQYGAIICLGAVIRGETSHYDYVCQQVSFGCQKVMLDTEIPVIFGMLTTETEEQALDRAGGAHGNKGEDAVATAFDMIAVKAFCQQG